MRWISTICGLVRPGCGLDHDHLVMWPRCEAYSAEASQLPRHRQSKVLVAGERACERYVDVRASLWPGEPVGKHLGKQPTLFGRTLRRAPTYPGRGGLITRTTRGRRRQTDPIIEPLRPTLVRITI